MAALARLQSSSVATPVLDLFTQVNGVLTDVSVLEYQVFDAHTGTPVQVYPGSGRASVNLAAAPTGQKLGTGHYVALWTVPGNESIGTHQVKWFFKLTPSTPEQTYTEEFEVLPEVVGTGYYGEAYCTVAELREEGIPSSFSDSWLSKRAVLASRMIERWTGRFFTPRVMSFTLDVEHAESLILDQPIIALSSLAFGDVDSLYDLLDVRVYNRHITQNLLHPDDRNAPRITIYRPPVENILVGIDGRMAFPHGPQNAFVTGVFGYTDYDGYPNGTGKTPDLINHATKLMVFREVGQLSDVSRRADARLRGLIKSESTRDQSITYGDGAGSGAFTGDTEIDWILASYMRPPAMGAV